MQIPEHSHNFEIPLATKADILAKDENKVVGAASLGSAALAQTSDFATAKQGAKADNAVPAARFIKAGFGLKGGGVLTQDISVELDQKQVEAMIKEAVDAGVAKLATQKEKLKRVR